MLFSRGVALPAFAIMVSVAIDGSALADQLKSCPSKAPETKFPTKPITLVIPSSPGSGVSLSMTTLAQAMTPFLGQPVEVVYMPAGANNAAAVNVDQAPSDGYTITTALGSQAGYMNLPTFQPKPDDFLYIAQTEKQFFALAVRADSQFKTMADLIAYEKKHPNELALGATKVGSVHHRLTLGFEDAVGVKFRYTPYPGSGRIVEDLLGGHIPVGLAQPGEWLPLVQAGKVRMLLLLNDKRLPAFPDLPVPSDFGYGYEIHHQWYGLMVKKGTPTDRIEKLQWAVAQATASDVFKKYLTQNPDILLDQICDEKFLMDRFHKELPEWKEFMQKQGLIK